MSGNAWNDGSSDVRSDHRELARPASDAMLRAAQASPALLGHARANDDALDVASVWGALREQWRLVLGSGIATLSLVMAVTLLRPMEFTSRGRMYLGELDARSKAGSDELDLGSTGLGDVASELEIIKSRSIVMRAVVDSGLNTSIVPAGWSSPRYWQWLASRRDPDLLKGASRELAVNAASLPSDALEPQTFSVRFVSARNYELRKADRLVGTGALGTPFKSDAVNLTLYSGPLGEPAPGKTYELTVAPLEESVDGALANLSVTAPKAGGGSTETVKVVTLEFVHRSPQRAAEFLQQLMDAYLGERQSWKTADASAAETFVTHQLAGMRDTLDVTQKKLADYRSSTDLVVLDNEAKAMIEQMGKYEEQRVAARLQVSALSDVKRMLRSPNPPVEAYLLGETGDSVLNGFGRSLAEARQQLTELEGRFHDAAPDVRNQKAQIAAQLDSIRNYVSSRLARAQENLTAMNEIIGQFETKLKAVPGAELGLAQLARESEVYAKLYSYLLERQQQASIVKASTVSKNRVLDAPHTPRKESSPALALRLMSGVAGLLLGVLAAFLRRFFAATLQSSADLRVLAGGAPVLTSVPRYEGQLTALGASPVAALARGSREATTFAEAFRTLRTCVYQRRDARNGQVILVTSPTPGDGKTTSTLSLAAMLAADEKWVLVVDADLRKPSHHRLFGFERERGLREILNGQLGWRDAVHPVRSEFGEFFSIGAGRVAPAELMSSERMARFLAEARQRYDFVLLDAPSFPLFADPLALAPLADGVLSVMRLGHTPRRLVEEHVHRLSGVVRHYGIIVNGASPGTENGYGKAYPHVARGSLFSHFKDVEAPMAATGEGAPTRTEGG